MMLEKGILPSRNLIEFINKAEANLGSEDNNSFIIYHKLRGELERLNPREKKLLARYVSGRCSGKSIEQSMEAAKLFTAGLKIVEEGLDRVAGVIIVDPIMHAHKLPPDVNNITDWVLERASQTANWFRRNRSNTAINQWTKLIEVIQAAAWGYNQSTAKFEALLNNKPCIDQDLGEKSFHENIPLFSEQAVLTYGAKEISKIYKFGRFLGKSYSLKTVKNRFMEEIFGKLNGKSIRVTKKGLGIVKRHIEMVHIESKEVFNPNLIMIERLEEELKNGGYLSQFDASFYLHEVKEATLVEKYLKEGDSFADAQEFAHKLAFMTYSVSPFSVYHPIVSDKYPDLFNKKWKNVGRFSKTI
ncbi:MAG: hypothetical protein ChlgKO_06480 [Chlamydiales bacterium]